VIGSKSSSDSLSKEFLLQEQQPLFEQLVLSEQTKSIKKCIK